MTHPRGTSSVPDTSASTTGVLQRQALNVTLDVSAEIDASTLRRALARTQDAHQVLVGATAGDPVVEHLDLTGDPAPGRRAAAFDAAEEFCATRPLLLDPDGTPVRALLLTLGGASVIALAIDPSVCDAWSANIIADEMSEFLDAHLDGEQPSPLERDAGPEVLAERRTAAARRGPGSSPPDRPVWWHTLTLGPAGAALDRALHDVDDAHANALADRCRTARASIFPAALLALQVLQADPVQPRSVISTFAGREGGADQGVVAHLAVDVLVPVAIRGLTVSEAVRSVRDGVFEILSGPLVDWRDSVRDIPAAEQGITVSVLYLPSQLSGGGEPSGSSRVRRASVSVCPTGADLDLFVIERPPIDQEGRTPALRLGGTLNRAVAGFDLDDVLRRWGAVLAAMAQAQPGWDTLPWPDLIATGTGTGVGAARA